MRPLIQPSMDLYLGNGHILRSIRVPKLRDIKTPSFERKTHELAGFREAGTLKATAIDRYTETRSTNFPPEHL